MAHELYQLADGSYSMLRAHDSDTSWHGLETILPADATFDDWAGHPVFDWRIQRSKVRFNIDRQGTQLEMPSQHVLFRSDNHTPLSVVGDGYKIVQPKQVLEFFRDVCEANHLQMDTAGIIRNGQKFWALAKTGHEFNAAVEGRSTDLVKQYVLLASSADSSMATTAKHTSLRVVCSNTFHASINNGESAIKVRHSTDFNESQVKLDLGLMTADFDTMGDYAREMAKTQLTVTDAIRWYVELLTGKHDLTDEEVAEFSTKSRVFKQFWEGYTTGPGADASVWGAFNGVTFTVDHVRGRGFDTRFDSAQFGQGANLKQSAWDQAVKVIEGARQASQLIAAVQ